MSCKNKSARTEIISLKKPSALDKIVDKVPKPKGAVPNFGLPKWKAIPLTSKIPMVPGPQGAYNYSRQKLGKKLWIGTPDAEFTSSDPCNYETEFKYEGFHDEHLTEFYKRPINIQRMIKLGFVTEKLDAKCSLKDYNMYRQYLRKLHNDSVKKELKKQAEIYIERKDIWFAEEKSKKDMERLRKKENVRSPKEVHERSKKMRENKLRSKMRKYKDTLKKIEQARKEDLLKRIAKRKEKMEKVKQVHTMAATLKRQKLIKTLTNWKRKESERKKMRKIRLMKEEEERNKFIQDRWKKKQQFQIQQLEREKFLLCCVDQERQMFIQEYNKKIEKERRRMQNRLEKSRKFVKCYMARYISKHRRRTCCKIPKACQKKNKQSNCEITDSEITRKNNSEKEIQNNGGKNGGEVKRERKSKMRKLKVKAKTLDKKSQKKYPNFKKETNEDIELEEEFTPIVSCSQIIPQDIKSKSKCECEQVKFIKRYEILK